MLNEGDHDNQSERILALPLLIELSPLKSVECAGAMENQVHCEVRNQGWLSN